MSQAKPPSEEAGQDAGLELSRNRARGRCAGEADACAHGVSGFDEPGALGWLARPRCMS